MATVQEIVNGIQQAVHNVGYDGAKDEKGAPVEIGLRREKGHPIHDSRMIDGFSVKFEADVLCLNYHSEIKLKEVHEKGFEKEIEAIIGKVVAFLKKEYKKVTGNALALTVVPDSFKSQVETASRVRVWVRAQKKYTIGGMSSVKGVSSDAQQPKLDKAIRAWLTPSEHGKKPENVSIKKNDNKKKDS